MRKGFTLLESVIVLVVVGIWALVIYSHASRIKVERTCVKNGYVSASRQGYDKFCTRVENGNTVVIHVDSIR